VYGSFVLKDHGALESRGPELLGDLDRAAETAGIDPRLSGLLPWSGLSFF
jgi:hypothetical protein